MRTAARLDLFNVQLLKYSLAFKLEQKNELTKTWLAQSKKPSVSLTFHHICFLSLSLSYIARFRLKLPMCCTVPANLSASEQKKTVMANLSASAQNVHTGQLDNKLVGVLLTSAQV